MKKNEHKVFALKYRPKNFKELIGQDIMVQTVTNSIKFNKLPNAYLLTGIRGVGKTTTARLIAKAINCEKNFIAEKVGDYCDCNSCEEISNFKHLDVLEMDAASRTGIDDIRELIESSKYNPTSAKYKIYIIDEVHMLSKQAFNGLLKTLEEPPLHLKFIFATTEVKKIPLTIISRCQRFDLHRVSIDVLKKNLVKIAKEENCKISERALILISKAAEGSVRDSLSLLNRASVGQNNEEEIDEIYVRKMLGIVDRFQILILLKFILEADQKKSIDQLKAIISQGVEPTNFLNDFLEIIYFIQQHKNFGKLDSDLFVSESEIEMIEDISKNVTISSLILFWQFTLKGLEELSIVSNPLLSIEMLIIRLMHLKEMPSYDDLVNQDVSSELEKTTTKQTLESISKDKIITKTSTKDQIKSVVQIKAEPESLEQKKVDVVNIKSLKELIELSSQKREIELKYDLERNVNLIKFSEGKIDIAFNENLSNNFVRKLSEKLLDWTKKRWVITLTKGEGQKSFIEINKIKKKEMIENAKNENLYKKFKETFDDAELIAISNEE